MDTSAKQPNGGLFEYILTHYRGIFATVFLLPISVLYNIWFTVRTKIIFFFRSAPKRHDKRVEAISEQVRQWQRAGRKEKLCTSRSVWLTMSELIPSYKTQRQKIKLNLQDILTIDKKHKTVKVEPLVNMGQITASLLPLGWTLPVVPELDDLTVGGLIMGFGIESSSHKYGLFQHICVSFEIVTAEGDVVICSPENNADMFYAIPWSHGTLGILVSATLRIIPASKYIRITYTPLQGLSNIIEQFTKASRQVSIHDFVECLQFSSDQAVLITGNFADKSQPDGAINRIGKWYKPWFYQYVKRFLRNTESVTEYMPIREYYHRHTRSLFWEMEQIIPFGNHPVFRFFFGWALPPQIALMKCFETETTARLREQYHVVQDMLIPVSKLFDALMYFEKHYQIYPLWICPMRILNIGKGFIHPYTENGETDELYVDIGAYGTPHAHPFDGNKALHELEQFVIENKGYQALYARSMLSESDFRKMFDHRLYDIMQDQLKDARDAFGSVYEKMSGRVSAFQHRK